jgi:hypothetical protein
MPQAGRSPSTSRWAAPAGGVEEVSDWIGRTFSLSFDYAWPLDPDRAG